MVALGDVVLIDMLCPEQMEELVVVDLRGFAEGIENLELAPKCTFASDYVGM